MVMVVLCCSWYRQRPALGVLFILCGSATCFAATLLSLLALCPSMYTAMAETVTGGITEGALATLLRSWPQLRQLSITRGASFTDAVLRASVRTVLAYTRWIYSPVPR
jgi:hypothetical protein